MNPRAPRHDIPAPQQNLICEWHQAGLSPEAIVERLHEQFGVRRKPGTVLKVVESRAPRAAQIAHMAAVKKRLAELFHARVQAAPAAEIIQRELRHHLSPMGVRSAWWKMGLRRPALYRDRWRGRLPVPQHAHPFVRTLFRAMNKQGTSISDIAERAGVPRNTIGCWSRKLPRIDLLEAALNVLDYEIVVRARHPE